MAVDVAKVNEWTQELGVQLEQAGFRVELHGLKENGEVVCFLPLVLVPETHADAVRFLKWRSATHPFSRDMFAEGCLCKPAGPVR